MKLKYELLIAACLASCLFLGYYYFTIAPNNELEKYHKYTIGTVTRLQMPSDGAELKYYSYRVNGRTFNGAFCVLPDYKGTIKKDSRIYVMFSIKNPDISRAIYDVFVPDTLKAPENGWKVLPKF